VSALCPSGWTVLAGSEVFGVLVPSAGALPLQGREEEVMGLNRTGTGAAAKEESSRGGEFLTFLLAGGEYGLEILKVQEIIKMMDITPVPGTPECIKGVLNLRGKVIPIVDLRSKFGMPSIERTPETCIIVVQANRVQTGIVVDQVSEVQNIAGDEIEAAPTFGSSVRTDFILGIGKSEHRVQLLLDIDRVLADNDLSAVVSQVDDDTSAAAA
jgi:purine-binding chemotaxis protein CheW